MSLGYCDALAYTAGMTRISLDKLGLGVPGQITALNRAVLSEAEVQRLGAFGFEAGGEVLILHRAGRHGRAVLACKIGRMTIALRSAMAAAIEVQVR